MPPSLRCPAPNSSVLCVKHLRRANPSSSRPFSTTPRNEQRTTRARRQFFMWLGSKGSNFLNPLHDSPNYLNAYTRDGQMKRVLEKERNAEYQKAQEQAAKAAGKQYTPPKPAPPPLKEIPDPQTLPKKLKLKEGVVNPELELQLPPPEELPPLRPDDLIPFPMNRNFKSQPVLSEKFRKKIWEAVILQGKTVREVSAEYGVEMSRVGAVVRLMEVQKEWERIGKPLAKPYAEAVLNMVPKTLFLKDVQLPEGTKPPPSHESINDLPVHRATGQQIFWPTSESRKFTRKDAAKVFNDRLLPADDRIPHPELIVLTKEVINKLSPEERQAAADARREAEQVKEDKIAAKKAKEEAKVMKFDTGRWEYRFTDINIDEAGKDGRGSKGVGWRYGVPHMDRRRGEHKIPTAVA